VTLATAWKEGIFCGHELTADKAQVGSLSAVNFIKPLMAILTHSKNS
jgi:hypothetical protein